MLNHKFIKKQGYRELQKELKDLIKNHKFKVIECRVVRENTIAFNNGYCYWLYIELFNKGNNLKYITKTLIIDEDSVFLDIRFKIYEKGILKDVRYTNFFPNIEKYYNTLKSMKRIK